MIPSESLADIISAALEKSLRESLDLMAGNAITLALLIEQLHRRSLLDGEELLSGLSHEAARIDHSESTRICLRHTIAVLQSALSQSGQPAG